MAEALHGLLEAIAQEEPHPNPPLAKVRGPEVSCEVAEALHGLLEAIAQEEPHPNPDQDIGEGTGLVCYNWVRQQRCCWKLGVFI